MISNLIDDSATDIFVMAETWHTGSADLPLRHAALTGYSIVDAPRPGYDDVGVNHGGIAIIHRNSLTLRVITPPLRPTSFELLICLLAPLMTNSFFSLSIDRPQQL